MHTKTLFAKLVIPNIGYAESAEWINTSKVIFIAFMHKCLAWINRFIFGMNYKVASLTSNCSYTR